MRELKFRVWNARKKEMLTECDISVIYHLDNAYTIMQFTGLKDKNGVDIYEGDIVIQYETPKYPYDIKQQIFFADGMFCVGRVGDTQAPLNMETSSRIYARRKVNLIEVVGNIFEDENLLEETRCF